MHSGILTEQSKMNQAADNKLLSTAVTAQIQKLLKTHNKSLFQLM